MGLIVAAVQDGDGAQKIRLIVAAAQDEDGAQKMGLIVAAAQDGERAQKIRLIVAAVQDEGGPWKCASSWRMAKRFVKHHGCVCMTIMLSVMICCSELCKDLFAAQMVYEIQ